MNNIPNQILKFQRKLNVSPDGTCKILITSNPAESTPEVCDELIASEEEIDALFPNGSAKQFYECILHSKPDGTYNIEPFKRALDQEW